MTDIDIMLRFVVQLLVILVCCKIFGYLGQRLLGQAQVVMEMITGVILGPSVFGLLLPAGQHWMFPQNDRGAEHPSMYILYVVAQLGLIFYMFIIGLEFDVELIRNKARSAATVSFAGILGPFVLGATLALFVTKGTGLFEANIDQQTACLFLGAAMCITAFPMLARIIFERGIAGTEMGTLALGAGATGDVAAWGMLAVVLAFAHHSMMYVAYAVGGGLLYGVVIFKFARPLLAKLAETVDRDQKMSMEVFVSSMILLFVGAFITDAIGIFAVFGAFMMGAAMPRGQFVVEVRNRLESVTVGVFLPFFFVYSGLSTHMGALNSPTLWAIALAIILAAIVGKGAACTLAAKMCGENWRDSLAIGALMNSRGLMELIIINIGLHEHVITERLYTMLVLMAIVTTVMASPLFLKIYSKRPLPTEPSLATG